MNKRNDIVGAQRRAAKMKLADAVVTIAICGDESRGKCASKGVLREAWKHLKRRAKEVRKHSGQRVVVMRTECLGVCRFGPVAAVFPPGDWYGGCSPEVLDRILDAAVAEGEWPAPHCISPAAARGSQPTSDSD